MAEENPKPKTKADKFVEKLHGTDVKSALMTVMPKTLNYDKFMALVISQSKLKFKEHSHLQPASIIVCAYEAASLGLSFDPHRGEAYMVPFNCKVGKKDGKDVYGTIVTFIPGYRGLIKLCRNAGMKNINAQVVYEKDKFDYYEDEDGQHWKYIPCLEKDRGNVKCGFSVATLKDDTKSFKFVPLETLEKAKKASKSKTGPWKTWEEEMYLKTILKRHTKVLEQDTSLARAAFLDEQVEELGTPSFEVPKNLTDIVDADYIDMVESKKKEGLKNSTKPEVTETKPVEPEVTEEKGENTEMPESKVLMDKENFENQLHTLGLQFGLNNEDDLNKFLVEQTAGKIDRIDNIPEKEYSGMIDLFNFWADKEDDK